MDFKELHWHTHWTVLQAAKTCGVAYSTYRAWITGSRAAPVYAQRLAEVIGCGSLEAVHPHWRGFYIKRDGSLLTECQQLFSPSDINAFFFKDQLIQYLKNENARLQRELDKKPKVRPCAHTHTHSDSSDRASTVRINISTKGKVEEAA